MKKMQLIFLTIFGVTLILLLHLYASFFLSKYYGISTGDIVLIITAGVVFLYTWETRGMRKELVNQNKIQSFPFVSIIFEEEKGGRPGNRFLAINFGKGSAIDVKFTASQPIADKTPIFKIIEILPPGETKELIIERVIYEGFREETLTEGAVARSDFMAHYKLLGHLKSYFFELRYKGILEDKDTYQSKGKFEKSAPGDWNFVREEV